MIANVQLVKKTITPETIQDCTLDVIKGGVEDFAFEIEDEEGSMVIPSVSLSLSNINGSFNDRINAIERDNIKISVGSNPIFEGNVSEGGQSYDPDQMLFSLNCESLDKSFIDAMENVKIVDLPSLSSYAVLKTVRESSGGDVRNLQFISLKNILKLLIAYAGYNPSTAVIDVDETYFMGGTWHWEGKPDGPLLPDWTGKDFLDAVVKLINGIWWIGIDKKFNILPKAHLIAARMTETPLEWSVIKDSEQRLNDYLEVEKITYEYKEGHVAPSNWLYNPNYLKGSIDRSDIPKRVKEVETTFWLPLIIQGYAEILRSNDDQNSFLIRSTGNGMNDQFVLSAQSILETYYAIDLKSGIGVMADISIIDDPQFFANWSPAYLHLKLPNRSEKYFLRRMGIDLTEEKVSFKAVSYQV